MTTVRRKPPDDETGLLSPRSFMIFAVAAAVGIMAGVGAGAATGPVGGFVAGFLVFLTVAGGLNAMISRR